MHTRSINFDKNYLFYNNEYTYPFKTMKLLQIKVPVKYQLDVSISPFTIYKFNYYFNKYSDFLDYIDNYDNISVIRKRYDDTLQNMINEEKTIGNYSTIEQNIDIHPVIHQNETTFVIEYKQNNTLLGNDIIFFQHSSKITIYSPYLVIKFNFPYSVNLSQIDSIELIFE